MTISHYTAIIATHRRPEWLARAVASIKAQTHADVSLIIVSDVVCAETYGRVSPLLRPGDLFIQHWGGAGPAESRNIGIQLLSSDYAFFLDDDDEIPADFVASMEARRPQNFRGVVYSDFTFRHCRPDGVVEERHSIAANRVDDIYVKNFIPNSCLVYPTKILKGRRFDASLVLNEDWDFILNVKSAASLAHVPAAGPIIYKTPAPRRGNSNNHMLLENYTAIYGKWPAPNKELKMKRQTFLAQHGVEMPLSRL